MADGKNERLWRGIGQLTFDSKHVCGTQSFTWFSSSRGKERKNALNQPQTQANGNREVSAGSFEIDYSLFTMGSEQNYKYKILYGSMENLVDTGGRFECQELEEAKAEAIRLFSKYDQVQLYRIGIDKPIWANGVWIRIGYAKEMEKVLRGESDNKS